MGKQGLAPNIQENYYALLHQEQLLFYSALDSENADTEASSDAETADAEDQVNAAMDRLFAERGYRISEGNSDRVPLHLFNLAGCSIMSSSRQTLSLANEKLETCVLSFKSAK